MYKSFFKRLFDLFVACLSLILLFPFFIFISVLIMLDSPGPIFYTQTRLGKNKKPFKIYKFRTMVFSTENELSEFIRKLDSQELGPRRGNHNLKLSEDPRVTRIGKFLRKYSLNEIPQLINILKGDMSIVGPRASLPYEKDMYRDQQLDRFQVNPGITGLGQVEVRHSIMFDEMANLDTYYVRNISFIFDVEILMKTIYRVFAGYGGAY